MSDPIFYEKIIGFINKEFKGYFSNKQLVYSYISEKYGYSFSKIPHIVDLEIKKEMISLNRKIGHVMRKLQSEGKITKHSPKFWKLEGELKK